MASREIKKFVMDYLTLLINRTQNVESSGNVLARSSVLFDKNGDNSQLPSMGSLLEYAALLRECLKDQLERSPEFDFRRCYNTISDVVSLILNDINLATQFNKKAPHDFKRDKFMTAYD